MILVSSFLFCSCPLAVLHFSSGARELHSGSLRINIDMKWLPRVGEQVEYVPGPPSSQRNTQSGFPPGDSTRPPTRANGGPISAVQATISPCRWPYPLDEHCPSISQGPGPKKRPPSPDIIIVKPTFLASVLRHAFPKEKSLSRAWRAGLVLSCLCAMADRSGAVLHAWAAARR